jgi:protoheme IX farnesyltransferase
VTATLVETPPRSLWRSLLDYVALTKPHVIELLLVTTVPAMILAKGGVPPLPLILMTLAGGFLAAGGANAINCYVDRDIDDIMARTQGRPLPRGVIEPRNALLFGILLGAASFMLFAIFVNLLSAFLALGAYLFYVFVYTLWLKRSSPSNIVIGGAAGSLPPVIGWAAVTNHVALPALVLFGIIFIWTPPHFWSLALRYQSEYRDARVPMLPVVRGEVETRKQILLYSLLLVPFTLLLIPFGGLGLFYAGAAVTLGTWFILQAYRLMRDPDRRPPMRLFAYSISYLALLFGAMVIDQLLRNLVHSGLL